jgi:hypothetical protein
VQLTFEILVGAELPAAAIDVTDAVRSLKPYGFSVSPLIG